MAGTNAARYNPDIKAKYEAMIGAGKPAKVALTEVIELANALVRDDRK